MLYEFTPSSSVAPSDDLPANSGTQPSLLRRLSAAAERYSDRVAMTFDQSSLTYAECAEQIGCAARGLACRAYSNQSRVAILQDQGHAPVLASLAILQSGMIFVHLDSRDPKDRLRKIIDDCKPSLIITSPEHLTTAEQIRGDAETVLWQDLLIQGRQSPRLAPGKEYFDEIAYLVYTSGSTGVPKGVLQTHRNLLHFVDVYSRSLSIDSNDRLTMFYSLSFSAANMDIFSALTHGSTLCFYDPRRRGLAELGPWLAEQGITVLHAVPSLFRALCSDGCDANTLRSIRAIDLAGEPLYGKDLKRARELFDSKCRIYNHYAQTEASVIAIHELVEAQTLLEDSLPVGRAAAGMAIDVVDESGGALPAGCIGEIVLTSDHLSPGYWSSAWAERLQSVTPSQPEKRRFATGDLGIIDAHGILRCTGRSNQRVKINGQSVFLGEVEKALHRFPEVSQCVVVAREDGDAPWLCGFIEPERLTAAATINVASIRRGLADSLPAYMIPRELIVLEALPRNRNGKIDRLALSQLPLAEARALDSQEGADDALPQEIADLFGQLLQQSGISLDASFFELGGDSLKALQLHQQLQARYGCPIPLEQLLASATPRYLATLITGSTASSTGAALPLTLNLNTGGTKPPLFLVHGATGQAMVSPKFVEAIGHDRPFYAFQATGLDRSRKSHYSIPEMATCYADLIEDTFPEGPIHLVGLCVGSYLAVEIARLLRRRGRSLSPLLLIDPLPRNPGNIRLSWMWRRWLPRRRSSDLSSIRERLRRRAAQGRSVLAVHDDNAMEKAAFVTQDFTDALQEFRARPFDGPVILMLSQERAEMIKSRRSTIRRCLRHVQATHVVAAKHTEVLAEERDSLFPVLHEVVKSLDLAQQARG